MKNINSTFFSICFLCSFLCVNLSYADTAEKKQVLAPMPIADLQAFAEVFNHIREAYVEEIDDETLLEYAIQGMLAGLDPHSAYLSQDSYSDLKESTEGSFGGLGMEVGMINGYIEIIAPIDDTPAQRAGLQSGDIILKLDGAPLKGISLPDTIDMMRGSIGSPILLTILRQGQKKPFDVKLVRDTIRVKSVRSKELEPGYHYIRVAQFQNRTGEEFKKALNEAIANKQEFKGLVIDLRNNPGGILQAAVDIVDSVLNKGKIVYTEGRLPSSISSYSAKTKDIINNKPIVVLINSGSASASEIVAGALQDNRRAVIIGTESFGKGSVQTVLQLNKNRAIKLTTARYFTPNGTSIQAQGITPDIVVEKAVLTRIKDNRITESDLQGHLSNKKSAKHKQSNQEYLLDKDNQLYEALNLLKGLHLVESRKAQAGN